MPEATKAAALVTNFTGQWLELRNLEEANPDKRFFPTYSDQLRDDMRKETELYFEHVMREAFDTEDRGRC